MSEVRRRIARSRLAPAAALPMRIRAVTRENANLFRQSAKWLIKSREHTNFTYDLTPRNRGHLAWWVAAVTGADAEQAREYIQELDDDQELREHIEMATASSPRRRLADTDVRFARRAGWYAIVRALRPSHVMETGTDKGLGSCVLASALLRNGSGRLTTLDVNADSGYLITGRYAEAVDRVIGDSVAAIRTGSSPVDVFLHDSWHTYEHERAEFDAIATRLTGGAIVLTDNADVTDALLDWSSEHGRNFLYFAEKPERHWFPGGGIGASFKVSPSF